MTDCREKVHSVCAHAFHEIAVNAAQLDERTIGMDEKLDAIGKAVLGNGDPHHSLASRVERLEAASVRTWKVVGVCAVIVASIVAVLGLIK